ncbi:MAG TPA: hypothetical protein VJ249_02240 [Candidatus Bathyarchaeia archaeon]|nr:hypothetical protein [Candidatus Bathyarchaeia archaeon]
MYSELYEAWKQEKASPELQSLPKDFYVKLADYMRKIREESRMLDEKTTRARLLMIEEENTKKMVKDLILVRYKKTVKLVSAAEAINMESLTKEEEDLVKNVAPTFESFQALLKEIVSGRLLQASREKPKKRVLRFQQETPSIIGADMKTYGPFQPQDVASLPVENAKILVKQGVAVEVDVKLEPS